MRILWVKTGPLLPLDTGGKKRTHAMLTEISREHQVTYLSLLPHGQTLHDAEEADPYAHQKTWVPHKIPAKNTPAFWLRLGVMILGGTKPYALQCYHSPALESRLADLARADAFDLVICDFLAPALNFARVAFPCPVILFQHNMEAQIWGRLADNQRSFIKRHGLRMQHRRMRRWEKRLSALFDGVITVSPEDAAMAREDYQLRNVLGHVPTGVDVNAFRPAPPRPAASPFTIGFLGSMDWMPNIDACLDFARETFPLVQAGVPGSRFKIIGRNPSAAVRELARQNASIEVTGTVDDVQPHVHDCDVIVVPLKAGGGTRIKIYEAMAMGVPVVSTSIGAEGLHVSAGESILIADAPGPFAETLARCARQPDLRRSLAANALREVTARHSWSAAVARFMELCLDCQKHRDNTAADARPNRTLD